MNATCRNTALALTVPLLGGCGGGGGGAGGEAGDSATTTPPPPPPPATSASQNIAGFSDATSASNIDYEVGFLPRDSSTLATGEQEAFEETQVYAIGGAAAGDYNGDGYIDVFVARGDGGPNLLYRNERNLAFIDVAAGAGVAYTKSPTENYAHSGPTFADMDGDRDLDLFLGGLFGDPSMIFRNNGDGTFADVTPASGIDGLTMRNNVSAAFGDYDLDGDLDLFVSHWGSNFDRANPGDTQHLWENISTPGQIAFASVTVAAQISPIISTFAFSDPKASPHTADFTLTPTFARINDDLHPDILSVADFNESMVFINNADGTFANATDVGVIIEDNGMGSALGDYDNDGDLDWFVSSIYGQPLFRSAPIGNRLYRNDGSSAQGVTFTDVSAEARIANGGWGWAACFLDFENDGDLDIYHTNGWPSQHMWGDFRSDASKAFVSNGFGRFTERAEEMGLDDTEQGRGVVCADFDNDGDTDILLLHKKAGLSATLFSNGTSGNNYLRVQLRGTAPNTEAAGARMWARIGSREQMREIMIGNNFISQNPTIQIFGLGTAASVDELRIEWPDGRVTTTANVPANQTYVADQPGFVP